MAPLCSELESARWEGGDRHQSLISMSTPAGRSSRISESTVFGVGLWMSISRLCVRTSKCSRESLSGAESSRGSHGLRGLAMDHDTPLSRAHRKVLSLVPLHG